MPQLATVLKGHPSFKEPGGSGYGLGRDCMAAPFSLCSLLLPFHRCQFQEQSLTNRLMLFFSEFTFWETQPSSKETNTETPLYHHQVRRPTSHWEPRWRHCSLSTENGQQVHLTHILSMGISFLPSRPRSAPLSKNL